MQIIAVDGDSGCGRPRKTWEHVIMEALHVEGIRREVAQNCARSGGDLPQHEQSNPCLHGIIMDLKTMMMFNFMQVASFHPTISTSKLHGVNFSLIKRLINL